MLEQDQWSAVIVEEVAMIVVSRCRSSEYQSAQWVHRMQLRAVVAMIAVVSVVVVVVVEVVEEVLLVTRDVKAQNTSAFKGLTECNLWSRDCNIFVK